MKINDKPNWCSDEHGDPNKKGVKWDKEPSYCPACCGMDSFKTGSICKKTLFGKKGIDTVTHHKEYNKGYTNKKGDHFCGKCNHITGISMNIKWSKKEKEQNKARNEEFRKEHMCECGKYLYGYEHYEVGNKLRCPKCFKEKLELNKHFIRWW